MNLFNKIRGQHRALEMLHSVIDNNKIGGSYLFYGPEGVGKYTTALYFAMAINCLEEDKPCGTCYSCKKFLSFSHPDFIYLFPTPNMKFQLDGSIKEEKFLKEYESFLASRRQTPWNTYTFSQKTELRVDAVRMLIHRISFSPNEAKYRICLLEAVDLMNRTTANAFLKTLEEPPPNTIMLLTSSRPDFLLPTILSRCRKVPFLPLSVIDIQNELLEEHGVEAMQARVFARLASGNMEKALQLLESGNTESRADANELKELIVAHDDLGFMDFLGKLRQKPPSWLYEVIIHLQISLADIAFFEHNQEYLVNIDRTHLIEMMYHKYPNIDENIWEEIRFLEDCQKKLKGNVNSQLILIEIYNRFCELFC
ncbi:MAG: DNA polymerase III subunit [Candidatus Cloacimonetes bacterium]|nr:DNA polymerase III subunit [Candidatus Cloacimonadota bacterium]